MITRRRALALGGLGLAAAAVGACTRDTTTPAASSLAPPPQRARRLAYGEHAAQIADLLLPDAQPDGAPARRDGRPPVVVLVHGGFWRDTYDLGLMALLADDLVARGWAVLNVEYRRLGDAGGGWPGTFADVGAAVDLLADGAPGEVVDAERVIVVGHSAGGHLALWAAARAGLPADAPGARPLVRPVAAVGQAAVCDLVRGADQGLGGGACVDLLGGTPEEVPARYALASPRERVPLQVPQVLVHGSQDTTVPLEQSAAYARAAAAAGDDAEVVVVGGGHLDHLDPFSEAWRAVTDALPAVLER